MVDRSEIRLIVAFGVNYEHLFSLLLAHLSLVLLLALSLDHCIAMPV